MRARLQSDEHFLAFLDDSSLCLSTRKRGPHAHNFESGALAARQDPHSQGETKSGTGVTWRQRTSTFCSGQLSLSTGMQWCGEAVDLGVVILGTPLGAC